jgi:iron complex transport system permease protein
MSARRLALALAALVASIAVGVAHGPTPIALGAVLGALVHPGRGIVSLIVWQIRLPRVIAAGLVGAGLAGAGVAMQALLRNPLADPYIVGASAGAGLGAVLTATVMGSLAPGGAFVGALLAVAATYGVARSRGRVEALTLILAGYALGVMLAAVQTFVLLVHRQSLGAVFTWEAGAIHGMTWSPVGLAALLIVPAAFLMVPLTPSMNALLLGDETASHLGVRVTRLQLTLLALASVMTAAAVYLAGLVGFVGLVVPHVVRRLTTADHRQLLPLAVLWGAAFLILADTLAESLPLVGAVPVGLLTAVLGGPYFLWLLVRTQRSGVVF